MEKTPEECKVEKEISQLQNHQKILVNRKRQEERRARNHRLIERGAILEAVFPAALDADGEAVKAFLIALSHLSGAREIAEKTLNAGNKG